MSTYLQVVSFRVVPTGGSFGTRRNAAVYSAVPRKSDGVLTWRCTDTTLRAGGWTIDQARREAQSVAWALRLPFIEDIRHGTPVSPFTH